jgi:hypothetical protein
MEGIQQQNQLISSKIFVSKFRSKIECVRFLTIEGGAYLPNHKVITLYFIRSLISG